MNKLLRNLYKYKNQIYKLSILVFSIFFLSYIFPKREIFRYQFVKGKSWNYKELKAPFNFSIYKTDEELFKQKKKIKENKRLHFYKNNKLLAYVLKEFEKFTKDKDNKQGYIKKARLTIFEIYQQYGYVNNRNIPIRLNEGDLIAIEDDYKEIDETQELVFPYGKLYTQDKINDLINDRFPVEHTEGRFYNKLLKTIIIPDVRYEEELTEKAIREKIAALSQTKDLIYKDEVIISQNDIIDKGKFQKLFSLKKKYEEQVFNPANAYLLTIGYVGLITLLLLILFFYLHYFEKDIYIDNRKIFFLIINIWWVCTVAIMLLNYSPKLLYAAPICILPVTIRAFFNFNVSLIVHFITVLLLSIAIPNSFEFLFIQLITGAIVLIKKKITYKRVNLFFTMGKVTLAYLVSILGLTFIRENSLENIYASRNIFIFFFNIISILFSYPLIYLFERLFNLTSDLSLLELSDTNTPILRMLSQSAPGTLQHSITVATLAEESAVAINANPLLVRIGAMYHDIGKMKNSAFFTENQHNMMNPHEDLPAEESTKIILNHIIDGIEIGKKYHLPDRVIDFIRTHHGTTIVYFFYKKYKEENADKEIDKDLFRYPGPKPFSKETAIVMICDAVEAASKSIHNPSSENLGELVEKIVKYQQEEGQFSNSDITLKEIEIIKRVLKKKLMSIYHTRISYPET